MKADELFDRDKFIAKHVKDENMYNFEKSDDEREFQEFEKTEHNQNGARRTLYCRGTVAACPIFAIRR